MNEEFDAWFSDRFPNERIGGGYYKEWVNRFKYSNPANHMDKHTFSIWFNHGCPTYEDPVDRSE